MSNANSVSHLFIISGPSGSGKSTLTKRFIAGDRGRSICYPRWITRVRRTDEVEEVDGRWITDVVFKEMVYLEQFTWTFQRTYGKFGIKADEIYSQLNDGKDVFLHIGQAYDVVRLMQEYFGERLTTIFIYASPNIVWERVLKRRGERETIEVKRTRYREAVAQIRNFDTNGEI